MDDSKTSFRNKVKTKFNPQVPKSPTNNKGKESAKYFKKKMTTMFRRNHTPRFLPNIKVPIQ